MKKQIFKYTAVFALLIAKISLFGFKYFPTLDDYIQYKAYSLYSKKYILFFVGTVFKRPAAAFFDLFICRITGMYPALLIITAMLFFSAVMLKNTYKSIGVNLGRFFIIFVLFCPLNFEAAYWISASSRIVSGMFFCALSLIILARLKGKIRIFLFFFANLLSFLFYEQSLVFSFVTTCFFLYFKEKKLIFIPVFNLVLTAAYYIFLAPFDRFGERGEIGIKIIPHIKSLSEIFFSVLPKIILKAPHIALSAVIFACFLSVFSKIPPPYSGIKKRSIIYAVLIMFLPFAPYVFLKNSYLSLRSIFFAVMAIGIILDNICFGRRTANVLCALLLSVFIIGNASELSQYRAVNMTDTKILKTVSLNISDNETYYLVGAKRMYVNINAPFAEHILNITQADWSLTGALRAYTGNKNIKKIIPVENDFEVPKNFKKIYIGKATAR